MPTLAGKRENPEKRSNSEKAVGRITIIFLSCLPFYSILGYVHAESYKWFRNG
ncbi:hypothetical protein RchiOBHm_Chr3g0480121 [Rosa chinensis]|uniref:Uncharacterized protein n=1 Tax=Rosa chinensis TaxID=74649 RepID=A0A2P6RDM8_ROSCH|nr:hypothetical protein RchiOBHm_Chr3g0480121 [Rosa chinensis]